jgi:hypothetical protein
VTIQPAFMAITAVSPATAAARRNQRRVVSIEHLPHQEIDHMTVSATEGGHEVMKILPSAEIVLPGRALTARPRSVAPDHGHPCEQDPAQGVH